MKKCNEIDEHVSWDYYNKFNEICNKYLPQTGEGESIATQVVTVINKLVYKWYNDGDVFDNTHYLSGWANDLSSYANWLYKNIAESRPILNCIEDATNDCQYEVLLKELADRFLSKEFLSKYNSVEQQGTIYDCNGKFKFVDLDENGYEDDEDDEM